MNRIEHRLMEIALRKGRLIARAEAQRAAIGQCINQLRSPLAIAERGLAVVRFFRAHPVLVAGAVAALVALRGRGLLSLAGRAFSIWRLWRSASAWAAGRFT